MTIFSVRVRPSEAAMPAHSTERMRGAPLQQLSLEAGLPLLVRLGLRHALLLQCRKVLVHSVELGLDAGAVRLCLCSCLVQTGGLLGLVCHILILGCLFDCILLRLGIVSCLS